MFKISTHVITYILRAEALNHIIYFKPLDIVVYVIRKMTILLKNKPA